MAIARTLYEKIVESHTVKRIDRETVLLYVDAHFANEYTSPQAFSGVRERGCGVLLLTRTCAWSTTSFHRPIPIRE